MRKVKITKEIKINQTLCISGYFYSSSIGNDKYMLGAGKHPYRNLRPGY